MPDEPEKKEQDPVEAIRSALQQAVGFLKGLLGREEEELKEEMQEVEVGEQPATQVPKTPPQQKPFDQRVSNDDSDA